MKFKTLEDFHPSYVIINKCDSKSKRSTISKHRAIENKIYCECSHSQRKKRLKLMGDTQFKK